MISTGSIPNYIKYTINTILSVDKNANLYLATDQRFNLNNVKTINISNLESEQTCKVRELNIYKNNSIENERALLNSLLRIFYLKDIQDDLDLEEIVHFDIDTLIYKPFNKVDKCFDKSKFNITSSSNIRLTFGYSYIPNLEVNKKVCNTLEDLICNGHKLNWAFNNYTPPNIMDLLGLTYQNNKNLFNLLPNLPYESEFVFDPSSYGKYLDGSQAYQKKFYSRRSINFNDSVGVELYSNRINAKFKDSKPLIDWENKKYDLINLCVQSKRFNKFLPKEYRVFK